MRICIIGKFPPIQGGVSMRTYRTAHALAARGHDVHVVTNAKEVRPPFRMHMRAEDWNRCEAKYEAGSVSVHWTDPVDRSQTYIPMASPFVSKLAAVAAAVHSERPFDVIYSHYLEPYGVAGHLAAQMAGVPHVARMAGSDAGRLWHHPQFEALYDHVLRSAEAVIATGAVAERAVERGVAADRIAFGGRFVVPEDLFTPEGPVLDLSALRAEVEADPRSARFGVGRVRGRPALFRGLRQARREQGLVRAARRNASAQAGRHRGRTGRTRAWPTDGRKKLPRPRAQARPGRSHSPDFHFFPIGACPNSCVAVSPSAVSSRTSRSDFTRRSSHSRCCFVGHAWSPRPRSSPSFPPIGRLPHGYGCVAIEDVDDDRRRSVRSSPPLREIPDRRRPSARAGARLRATCNGTRPFHRHWSISSRRPPPGSASGRQPAGQAPRLPPRRTRVTSPSLD